MTYVPLARKYRPTTFDELLGQPHVATTLKRALEQGRIAQAYLFTGQRGVGKTSAARILAKCLNCQRGPTGTPCNQCAGCSQIAQGHHLDVIEIDGASNRGIDEIRGLRETVPFAPTSGAFRVYIIDEVHMLTPEAFNALLKTLEEPPPHVKFIFATTAAHKVPATVVSRCQRFDFRRLEIVALVDALRRVAAAERIPVSEAALFAVARAAEGSLRDAEVVLEQMASFTTGTVEEADVTALLGTVESDTLWRWAQAVLDCDTATTLALLMEQLEQGKEAVQLVAGLLRHLRNLLIVSATQRAADREALVRRLVDEPSERMSRLEQQAAGTSAQELLCCLQIVGTVYEVARRSPMGQTLVELALVKLCAREQWQSLEEISQRLDQLSAGGRGPAPPAASASPMRRSAIVPAPRAVAGAPPAGRLPGTLPQAGSFPSASGERSGTTPAHGTAGMTMPSALDVADASVAVEATPALLSEEAWPLGGEGELGGRLKRPRQGAAQEMAVSGGVAQEAVVSDDAPPAERGAADERMADSDAPEALMSDGPDDGGPQIRRQTGGASEDGSARGGAPAADIHPELATADPSADAVGAQEATMSSSTNAPGAQMGSSVSAQDGPTGDSIPAPDAPMSDSTTAREALHTWWPAFLERLGAQKMSLAAYLAHAVPLQLDGDRLTVGVPGFALHHEVLNQAEPRRLIDRLLSEVLQRAVTINYAILADTASSPSAAATAIPPLVQEIVKLFNATIERPRPT
jgi:DNA polymerase-3 subunit gamma/tau